MHNQEEIAWTLNARYVFTVIFYFVSFSVTCVTFTVIVYIFVYFSIFIVQYVVVLTFYVFCLQVDPINDE